MDSLELFFLEVCCLSDADFECSVFLSEPLSFL